MKSDKARHQSFSARTAKTLARGRARLTRRAIWTRSTSIQSPIHRPAGACFRYVDRKAGSQERDACSSASAKARPIARPAPRDFIRYDIVLQRGRRHRRHPPHHRHRWSMRQIVANYITLCTHPRTSRPTADATHPGRQAQPAKTTHTVAEKQPSRRPDAHPLPPLRPPVLISSPCVRRFLPRDRLPVRRGLQRSLELGPCKTDAQDTPLCGSGKGAARWPANCHFARTRNFRWPGVIPTWTPATSPGTTPATSRYC